MLVFPVYSNSKLRPSSVLGFELNAHETFYEILFLLV
jgi:hypothetical protein